MSKKILIAVLTIMGLMPPLAFAESSCSIEKGKQVSCMPPVRDQKHLGFCYAFSLASAIDQFNCTNEGSSYRRHRDMVSVLDIIDKGNLGNFKEGGNSMNALANIYGKFSGLAKESCFPYEKFVDSLGTLTATKNVNLTSAHAISSALNKKDNCTQELINEPVLVLDDLRVQLIKISEKEAAAKISLPEKCAQNQMETKDLSTCAIPFPKDGNLSESFLNEVLQDNLTKNSPVIFDFMLNDSIGHSTLLHGWRDRCCGEGKNNCRREYLIRDSGRVLGNRPGDYWVDQDFVHDRVRGYLKKRPNAKASFNPEGITKNIVPGLTMVCKGTSSE